jgi:hypothetical protein
MNSSFKNKSPHRIVRGSGDLKPQDVDRKLYTPFVHTWHKVLEVDADGWIQLDPHSEKQLNIYL